MMQQPLAYVHPGAKIAASVILEPFVVIHDNVEIDEGTWIGSHSIIMEGARIGKNCKIFPGAVISAVPQDLKYDGEETLTILQDNVIVREHATVNRGTRDRWKTEVGKNTLLMANSHLGHDCIIGKNVVVANAVVMGGHVTVGDYAIIGGLSALHQFVRIGSHVILSGGSLARKDIPPYIKAAREPLSYAGVNSIGLRRRGFESDAINAIQDIYRYIYLKSMNTTQSLEFILKELPVTEERDEIVQFISESERGIIRGYKML